MLICPHLIYAPIPKIGITLLKSSEIKDIHIPEWMYKAPHRRLGVAISLDFFPVNNRNKVAITHLKAVKDELLRDFIMSHTILIDEEEYLKFGAHPILVESSFITSIEQIPITKSLEPIRIDPPTQQMMPDETDISTIKRYIRDPSVLSFILYRLINKEKVNIEINGSDNDSLKLIYSILKLMPGPLRLRSFSSIQSHREYCLVIHADRSLQSTLCYPTPRPEKNKLSEDIARAVFTGRPRDLIGIHEKFMKFFNEHKDRDVCKKTNYAILQYEFYGEILEPEDSLRYAKQLANFQEYKKAMEKCKEVMEAPRTSDRIKKEAKDLYIKCCAYDNDLEGLWKNLSEFYPGEEKLTRIEEILSDSSIKHELKHNVMLRLAADLFSGEDRMDVRKYPRLSQILREEFLEKHAKEISDEVKKGKWKLYFLLELSPPVSVIENLMNFNSLDELKRLMDDPERSIFYIYTDGLIKYSQAPQPDRALIRTMLDFIAEKLRETIRIERHKLIMKEVHLLGLDPQSFHVRWSRLDPILEDLFKKFGNENSREKYKLFKKALRSKGACRKK